MVLYDWFTEIVIRTDQSNDCRCKFVREDTVGRVWPLYPFLRPLEYDANMQHEGSNPSTSTNN